MKIVIDTHAWIELFIGSDKGRKVKEVIAKASDAFVPDIVFAEIARKYLKEGADEETVRQRLEWVTDIARIPVNEEVALLSGKVYLELVEKSKAERTSKPGLAAIVLAIARMLKAKVVTGDKHFKGLKEVVWIGE